MNDQPYWRPSAYPGRISRRRALGLAGSGATGIVLAACSSGNSNNSSGRSVTTSAGVGAPPAATGTAVSRSNGGTTAAGGSTAAGTPAANESPVRGGTLRAGTYLNVLGIDPHISVSFELVWINKIYSRLGGYSSTNAKFNPIFAESVEQPSPTEFIFKLRQGWKFHNIAPVNGREQTAADILYSLQRFRDLPQAQGNDFYKSVVDTMEVPDPYTFRLTTKLPYAETLTELGNWQILIVPHEAVEKFGDLSQNAIGAGPFILDEYVKGEHIALKRNPDYGDKTLPYLDGYKAITILDPQTLLQAYKSDQIDINGATITKSDYEDLQKNNKLVNSKIPALYYGSFAMNASIKPYNDKRVRQALYVGIDRGQFIDKVGEGDGVPMGPLSAGLDFWALSQDELKPYIGLDVKKAKDLLAAAGYANGFDVTIETSGGVPLYISHANIMVSELKKLGINAKLNLTDLPSYLSDKLFKGDFDTTIFTHNPYETPKVPIGFYHKNGIGSGSWWHYDNEDISAAIDAENQEVDVNKRQQLVKQVQKMILDDAGPLLNLFSLTQYNSMNRRVGGFDLALRQWQYLRNSEYIRPTL